MKIKTIVSVSLLVVFISSCAEILDDCTFFPVKPRIKTDQIINGFFEQKYFQRIEGEVKNDPNDDDFIYSFEISGNLPTGINHSTNGRQLILEGTPSERGAYKIEVEMTIREDCLNTIGEEDFDCDNICIFNDTDKKQFELKIE